MKIQHTDDPYMSMGEFLEKWGKMTHNKHEEKVRSIQESLWKTFVKITSMPVTGNKGRRRWLRQKQAGYWD